MKRKTWDGPYRIYCPKCKGRNIFITEVTEALSEHFVKNGVWDHSYDNNDYGIITESRCYCDDCGHKWRRKLTTIDSYLKE